MNRPSMSPALAVANAPAAVNVNVDFSEPAPGVLRMVVLCGPTMTGIDLPHAMAEQLFRRALAEIAKQRSGLVIADVPLGLPRSP